MDWTDPPPMHSVAPEPAVVSTGAEVWLAYRTDRGDHFAVLHFTGIDRLAFGGPGDEPAEAAALPPRSFHAMDAPPRLPGHMRRWLITFPDETFDVVARDARIVVRAVHATDSNAALGMVLA